jgi:hypothetical protein
MLMKSRIAPLIAQVAFLMRLDSGVQSASALESIAVERHQNESIDERA